MLDMVPFTSFRVTSFLTALPPSRATANFEAITSHIPAPAELSWSCSSVSSPPSVTPTAS